MKFLRHKKAMVTGAASGIGRAIALDLAREGVDLFLLDRDSAELDAAAQEGVSTSPDRRENVVLGSF